MVSIKHRRLLTVALLGLSAASANAQYKCVQANGKVAFQQLPCAAADNASPLKMAPAAAPAPARTENPRTPNWGAIARGEPAVGMSFSELKQAIGEPNRANLAQYGANTSDQLIYYKGHRTLYVYLRNGVVHSIQNTAGGEVRIEPVKAACPSPQQIKNLEFEASRIANRDNPLVQAELARALACQ